MASCSRWSTTWFGWWEPALFPGRIGPAWVLVVPALFALVALINIALIGWRTPQARLLPLLLVGTLLVGFAEELASRGVLAVGLREAGASEVVVWLVTSVLFSLLHAMNVLFGQSGRTTLVQLVMAFFAGSALYVTVMSTGSLLVAMVLHALWDFGTLGILATERQQKPLAGLLAFATFGLGRRGGGRRRDLGLIVACDVDHYESARLRECGGLVRRCHL